MCGMIPFLSPLRDVLRRLKTRSSVFGAAGCTPRDLDDDTRHIHTQNACPLPHVPSKDTHKGNEDFLAGCEAVSSDVSRRSDETWYHRPEDLVGGGRGPFLLKPQSLKTKVPSFFETPGNTATRRHNRQDMNSQHTKILHITPVVSPQYCCDKTNSIAVVTRKLSRLLEMTPYGLVEVWQRCRGFYCLAKVAVATGVSRHMTELSRKQATPASLLVVPVFTGLSTR